MPTGEQCDEEVFDDSVLTDNHFANFFPQARVHCCKTFHRLSIVDWFYIFRHVFTNFLPFARCRLEPDIDINSFFQIIDPFRILLIAFHIQRQLLNTLEVILQIDGMGSCSFAHPNNMEAV